MCVLPHADAALYAALHPLFVHAGLRGTLSAAGWLLLSARLFGAWLTSSVS
jgi:hypothetical protein